jgi:hypothetical protein
MPPTLWFYIVATCQITIRNKDGDYSSNKTCLQMMCYQFHPSQKENEKDECFCTFLGRGKISRSFIGFFNYNNSLIQNYQM